MTPADSDDLKNNPDVSEDLEEIELTPTEQFEFAAPKEHAPVALVKESMASITSETKSLLHKRLQAVAILVIAVNAIVLCAALFSKTQLFGGFEQYVTLVVVRIIFFGVILLVLGSQDSYSNMFLRLVEYAMFGFLTVAWIYAHYQTILVDAQQNDITSLLVDDSEAMTQLLLIMIAHALLIPHTWQGAARVIFSIALAPFVCLLFETQLHPELRPVLAPLLTIDHITRSLLILLIGSLGSIYGASLLNTMRVEVHNARKFGQYQLLRLLGKGGMGEVYLAEHALLKRPCALKLIRSDESTDPTALARFEREVQSTAMLTHPNTIAIFDYGHTDDATFYYVMEFLPGISLEKLIAVAGPLPAGRVIYMLRQVCSALAEAHEAGMIHRDLKPANLYVTERGGLCDFIKVLDFGLVKLANDSEAAKLTADHVVSGTPHYMSPEQAVGERGLDGRSDLYSLGAIAYHMLTGHLLFEGDSPVKVMVAHASQSVVPPTEHNAEIPNDLEEVVLRSLEKEPAKRFQDIMEFDTALAACAAANDWNEQQAAIWWHERVQEAEVQEEVVAATSNE